MQRKTNLFALLLFVFAMAATTSFAASNNQVRKPATTGRQLASHEDKAQCKAKILHDGVLELKKHGNPGSHCNASYANRTKKNRPYFFVTCRSPASTASVVLENDQGCDIRKVEFEGPVRSKSVLEN